MKKFILKIPVIIILLAVFFLVKEEPKENFDYGSNKYIIQLIKSKIPDADSLEQNNYLGSWSEVYGMNGSVIAKYILTTPFCDEINGYGGKIPLIVVSDIKDRIIGLELLENRETPAWISGLKNIKFFDSWNEKKIEEIKDLQVDAVSGATYTSRAVREILKKRAEIFTGNIEYIKSDKKLDLKLVENNTSVVLYIILFVSIIALFVKKLNKYRIVFQMLSIIFFGIISGEFISIYLLESLSVNGFALFTSFTTVALLILSVVIPLIFNKHFYCYYICPFGGVQTVLGKLPVKKIKLNAGIIKLLRVLRLLIFVSIVIVIITSTKINLAEIEPFSIFIFSSATSITIIGSLVIFTVSIFVKNPWCLYFCPTGQLFDLLKDGANLRKANSVTKNK